MARQAPSIVLDSGERAALETIVRSPACVRRDVVRARIVLLAASGLRNDQIREKLGVSKPVVVKWRRRFYDSRLDGLADKSGRGRKRTHDAAVRRRIADAACSQPPASVGAYWSVRTLAKELGVSASLVQSVLRAESIRPHQSRYWRRSEDSEFEPKTLAIAGLYLHHPEHAVVLSVDEKASIRALDRPQPPLPPKPHRIERGSHEYERNDAASLLAALEVHAGKVQRQSIPRNGGDAFIRFLRRLLQDYPDQDLYVIFDDGSSHRSQEIRARAEQQEGLNLVCTPTRASWLRQTETCFAILARKVVRRGIPQSRRELVQRLMGLIESYDPDAGPFEWARPGTPFAA